MAESGGKLGSRSTAGLRSWFCSSIKGLRFCGSIGLTEMTRSFTPERFAQGLESWQWASGGTKTPLFTSPFGDVFFRAEGSFWCPDAEDLGRGAIDAVFAVALTERGRNQDAN